MPDERDADDELEDRDQDDADDADDEEEEESAETRLVTSGEEESQVDEPRNRAERRAELRRLKREAAAGPAGVRVSRSTAAPRVTVPKPTIKGASSADEVPPWAKRSVEWMSAHRGLLVVSAAAVIGVAGASVFWSMHGVKRHAEAAAVYEHALEMERGAIRGPDAPPEPAGALPSTDPTYPDPAARSRAALAAVQQVDQHYGGEPIAPLARLNEGQILYDLGRYAEARRVLEPLVSSGADLAGLQPRAYETLGFVLEALNDWPGALHRFETMASLEGGEWRDLAQFHQAGVIEHQGNEPRAKELLHGVIERLQHARGDETNSAREQGSVLEQARLMLHDIDPTDPQARPPEPAGDPQDFLRRLREHGLRGMPGAPGGGPAGGGGGGGEE